MDTNGNHAPPLRLEKFATVIVGLVLLSKATGGTDME